MGPMFTQTCVVFGFTSQSSFLHVVVTTDYYNFLSTSPNFTLSSHSQYISTGLALFDFILTNIVTATVATFIKR